MTRWPAYIELGLTIVGAVACTAGASLYDVRLGLIIGGLLLIVGGLLPTPRGDAT